MNDDDPNEINQHYNKSIYKNYQHKNFKLCNELCFLNQALFNPLFFSRFYQLQLLSVSLFKQLIENMTIKTIEHKMPIKSICKIKRTAGQKRRPHNLIWDNTKNKISHFGKQTKGTGHKK